MPRLSSKMVAVLGCLCLASLASQSRADVFGGIEIGAKGIKFTIVDATATPDGPELKVVGSGSANATLVAGLAKDGQFAPEAIKEAGDIVKKFQAEIEAKKVPAANVFLVGSSGIFSPIESKPEAVKANQEILAKAMLEATGLKMDFIDPRREAELSIKGMVPIQFRDKSLLIDVGSGNTKGGYLTADGKYVTFATPFGTTGFATKIGGTGADFVEKLTEMKKSALIPALHKELTSSPEFINRERIFLSGGVVYVAATLTIKQRKRPYTPIKVEDFDELEAKLTKDPTTIPLPDLSGVADEEIKKTLQAEVDRAKTIYKPEQLLAGVTILKAIATEMDVEGKKKQMFFVREGHLGWITAYVAEKIK